MTRVFIVAPTPMLRAGLRALLAASDIQVTGEAITLVGSASELGATDVVLLADDNLLEETARAFRSDGPPAIVVLSDNDQIVARLRSLSLPGWGVVSPEASADELQAAVSAADQGLAVLPLPLANRLLGPRTTADAPAEPLTTREGEVLGLLSEGLSNKLIARRLQISEHTVKFHVASIFTKLGASSRTDAVSRGARSGLITL